MTYGELVKKIQKKLGESNETFGKRIGAHEVTVSNWRRGAAKPSIEQLEKILAVVNLSMSDLLEFPEEREAQREKQERAMRPMIERIVRETMASESPPEKKEQGRRRGLSD